MRGKLEQFAVRFREAIERAKEAGEFDSDFTFLRFPCACCGDASDLLAQYLLENGIESTYVCGNRYFDDPEEGTQSHAWLLVGRFIVDITGDQFSNRSTYYNYNQQVYVGTGDAFHQLFEVEAVNVHEFHGIECYGHMCQARLFGLYRKIMKYCE